MSDSPRYEDTKHTKDAVPRTRQSDQAGTEKPFRFMDLPEELRLDIYDLLLTPGDVHVRWSRQSAGGDVRYQGMVEGEQDKPTKAGLQLLQVSKKIRDGAIKQFLSNNVFHIMDGEQKSLFVWLPKAFQPFAAHIKKLSIAFDRRCLDVGSAMDNLANYRDSFLEEKPEWTGTEWRSTMHDELQDELVERCWFELVDRVHDLQLRFLEVNLQNCCCPCACHGLVEQAVSLLCAWPSGDAPETIKFLGTRSVEERAMCKAIVEDAAPQGRDKLKVLFAGIFLYVDQSLHNAVWSGVDEMHVDPEEEDPVDDAAQAIEQRSVV